MEKLDGNDPIYLALEKAADSLVDLMRMANERGFAGLEARAKGLYGDTLEAFEQFQGGRLRRGLTKRLTKTQARNRLYDLLTSDIYTDAPEYADRVMEIHSLLGLVFKN